MGVFSPELGPEPKPMIIELWFEVGSPTERIVVRRLLESRNLFGASGFLVAVSLKSGRGKHWFSMAKKSTPSKNS